jgi:hypothetical protein
MERVEPEAPLLDVVFRRARWVLYSGGAGLAAATVVGAIGGQVGLILGAFLMLTSAVLLLLGLVVDLLLTDMRRRRK